MFALNTEEWYNIRYNRQGIKMYASREDLLQLIASISPKVGLWFWDIYH